MFSAEGSKMENAEAEEAKRRYLKEKREEFEAFCDEGDGNACNSLGEWWQVVGKDFRKAAGLFETNCWERGHGQSCYNLALLRYHGRGVSISAKEALRLSKRACELKHPVGCYAAARLLLSGRGGVARDAALAMELFSGACKMEHSLSCLHLGGYSLLGKHGMERDLAEARRLFEVACDGGEKAACTNLAVMYLRGEGVAKDEAKFDFYKSRAEELSRRGSSGSRIII
eukprot:PLAT14332.1.p1 GENE.PLAT14332.1~~PLAT14332.1.p1  ORF type:complete len:228 (+),score=64.92 PLAT14332.1:12-695(+)